MDVTFSPLTDQDDDELIRFLTTNAFPFHVSSAPSEEQVRDRMAAGEFRSDETRTYWIYGDNQRLGLLKLEDLKDDNPVFDLRLAERFRGEGHGVPVLNALTGMVFKEFPHFRRFEGQTREDNIAMRKTLLRCGFVKEAHYRQSWPSEGGTYLASVAYTILKSDWEDGTTTPVVWEDFEE
ncbi:GNAT family N-acetyltransferase [Arthrobacter roseus]|uniref:GNAT family N-acetyltransferase n=1 Tax=Arthrobacter roseus TaxID=136274 RepID=UPI0019647F4E|nr:GNAT family protein [Arthrobacter roseus]MBM7847937.1 RimJ/RimL family protein N-acetyltransferase [Arthrobacter roseus]